MVDFQLLPAEDYYQSLLKTLPKAKKRIVLAAMVVLWGKRTAPIFDMLQAAVKRGVTVTVLLDNYTRLTSLVGLHPSSSGPERLQQTFRTLEALNAQGAKVYNFGKIGFPPQKGRCHVKVTVIDDTSYAFGGVNFHDEQFGNADYMLTSTSPKLADCLVELVQRICTSRPPLGDGEVRLDKNTAVLFDGGRPKDSLIYERACELAAQAKHVQVASQMIPSGQLARLLHETTARIYTNRPEQTPSVAGIAQAFDLQRYRLENSYRGSRFIHCKIMLFDLPGGKKRLLSGSHNFSYRGVSFGTQEICLDSTDPKLWDQLSSFVQKGVIAK